MGERWAAAFSGEPGRALCFAESEAWCAAPTAAAGRQCPRLGPSSAFRHGAGLSGEPAVTMAARPPPALCAGHGGPCGRCSGRESDILRQARSWAVCVPPSSSRRFGEFAGAGKSFSASLPVDGSTSAEAEPDSIHRVLFLVGFACSCAHFGFLESLLSVLQSASFFALFGKNLFLQVRGRMSISMFWLIFIDDRVCPSSWARGI